jgi:phenylacetate-coenzyme A ligase PaaK-like adenylate-forming protein
MKLESRTKLSLDVEDGHFAHLLPFMLRESRAYLKRQWSRSEILNAQDRRLKATLINAARLVPYYYQLGILDIEVNYWEVFRQLPFIEKHLIQNKLEQFVADDFTSKKCLRLETSGSTGRPLVLLQDEKCYADNAA